MSCQEAAQFDTRIETAARKGGGFCQVVFCQISISLTNNLQSIQRVCYFSTVTESKILSVANVDGMLSEMLNKMTDLDFNPKKIEQLPKEEGILSRDILRSCR